MIYTLENTSKIGKRIKVFCDGIIVERCFYADTENGVAEAYKFPYAKTDGGDLETVRISGAITVEEIK